MSLRNPYALCCVAASVLCGCERKNAAPPFEVREGVVVERHSDTGELAVRVVKHLRNRTDERTVFCVVTKDSEVYIDDVLSRLDAVEIGDSIEILGYPDPNPRLERFVVSFAHVTPASGEVGRRRAAASPASGPKPSIPEPRATAPAAPVDKEP